MNRKRYALLWLDARIRPLYGRIFALMMGDILFAASSVLFALLCRNMIDYAIAGTMRETVKSAVFLFLLILLQFMLRLLLNRTEEYIRSKTGIFLRSYMVRRILRKDYAEILSLHSGEWMNRLFSDIQVISDGIATILPNLSSMATRLVCAVVVLVFLEPMFAGIFLVGGAVLVGVTGLFRKQMKRLHKDVQEKQGKIQAFLQEVIENFLVIRVFRSERTVEKTCDALQQEYFQAQMKRRTISVAANAGFSFIFQMGYLFSLGWGARGLYYGSMTYGTLTAILQLVGQIQIPVANLSGIVSRFFAVTASTERLMELDAFAEETGAVCPDDSEKEQADGTRCEGKKISFFQGLSVENVSFSYEKNGRNIQVLKEVSFQIRRGEIVALTGLSGGGKSTIFLLLLGIYHTDAGRVSIMAGGKRREPGKSTRSLFSYVPQGNGLFSGTILENLRMANEHAEEDQVWEALRIACADEFVRQLPEGWNTVLGERGSGFSEGQRQRIAIARAVLSEAPVLLLDEATSALDGETERKVLANIAAQKGRTCLIVTHREAALQICSRRIFLEDGYVREWMCGEGKGERYE